MQCIRKASIQMFVQSVFLLVMIHSPALGNEQELPTSAIYEETAPALVLIKTDKGAGSGFLIDQSGLIATAFHVVEEADAVQVSTSTGDIFDNVQLVAQDQRRDLAILKVAGFDLPVARLGNSNDLSPGDRLVIVGNPLGIDSLGGSVTEGIVSGVRDLGGGFRTIQTDAAISPGHSGSPVLDSAGDTVGIVSFRLVGGESLNFAIPINYLRGLQGMLGANPLSVWSTPLDQTDIAVPSSDAFSRDELSGTYRSIQAGNVFDVRKGR
jgi:S1-C subfamily serine protease